jgi:hypothetical protein
VCEGAGRGGGGESPFLYLFSTFSLLVCIICHPLNAIVFYVVYIGVGDVLATVYGVG